MRLQANFKHTCIFHILQIDGIQLKYICMLFIMPYSDCFFKKIYYMTKKGK